MNLPRRCNFFSHLRAFVKKNILDITIFTSVFFQITSDTYLSSSITATYFMYFLPVTIPFVDGILSQNLALAAFWLFSIILSNLQICGPLQCKYTHDKLFNSRCMLSRCKEITQNYIYITRCSKISFKDNTWTFHHLQDYFVQFVLLCLRNSDFHSDVLDFHSPSILQFGIVRQTGAFYKLSVPLESCLLATPVEHPQSSYRDSLLQRTLPPLGQVKIK